MLREIIEVLRQQYIICNRLGELADLQREHLMKGQAKGSAEVSTQIESLLPQLGKIEKTKEAILAQAASRDVAALLEKQPSSREREMAVLLLDKLQEKLGELQKKSAQNDILLKKNMQFVDFSVNVMTQKSADTTYAATGTQGTDPVLGMKMFDADV